MHPERYLHEEEALAGIVQGKLPNGASWVLWPDPRDSVVAVQIWVRTGSRDEAPGGTGLAHMLEHLMFRGTARVPDGTYDQRMEDLGAQINAATWLDYTFYETRATPQAMSEVLHLEADRFAGLALSEEVVATERDVVANERRQVIDADPGARLQEHFQHLAFGDGCYGWPTIGWAADIEAYRLQDVEAFFASHYAPSKICICVTGNFVPEAVVRTIEDSFGGLRGGSTSGRRGASAAAGASGWHALELPLAQDRLALGFRVPGRLDPSWPAHLLLQMALGGTEAARLPMALEVEEELVLHTSAALHGHELPHLLEVNAQLRPGVAASAVHETVLRELELVARKGLRAGERERLLDALELRACSALQRCAVRCEEMGEGWVIGDDPTLGFRLLSQVRAVMEDELRKCADTLLEEAQRLALHGISTDSTESSEGGGEDGA